MIFINNKYTNWYFSIIKNAKIKNTNLETYTESHHIIPRSLGGSNKLDNRVILTAREHYICHMLLVKMTVGDAKSKMWYAFFSMSNQSNNSRKERTYRIPSKLYEKARIVVSQMLSEQNKKQTPWHKGKKIRDHYTDEHMEKNRQNLIALNKSRIGKPMSEETKAKIRAKRALQVIPKGRKHSEETKAKIRAKRALQTNVKNQYTKRSSDK